MSESWREIWQPSLKVDPGAISGQGRNGRPQEDTLAVHCFCVCSGSALLGDLLGESRSTERDLLSVLSIYLMIFLHVLIVYRLLLDFFVLLRCVSCFGLVVSTWQRSDQKDSSCDTFMWIGDYLHKIQVEEIDCIFYFFLFSLFMLLCVSLALHNIYFVPAAWYSLFVLKMPLNTSKANQTIIRYWSIYQKGCLSKIICLIQKCTILHENVWACASCWMMECTAWHYLATAAVWCHLTVQ